LDEQIKKNGMGGKHNIQGNDQEWVKNFGYKTWREENTWEILGISDFRETR
jgi:hypothetical protein